jgi:hypothetical protein
MAKKDKGSSKVDMVRDAIGKIGWDAGIDDYQKYIKDNYGIEMSKAHISQTKSNEKKRQGIRRRRRRRGRAAMDGQTQGAGMAKLTDVLSFVSTIQEWEQKIGAKTVREVVKSVLKK